MRRRRSKNRSKGIVLFILIMALCMLVCLIALILAGITNQKKQTEKEVVIMPEEMEGVIPEKEVIYSDELEIHYIDIGHGDATLIRYKDYVIMIDVGSAEQRNVLVNYLEKEEIDHIDYLIFTHAHEDHVGNGVDLLMNYQYDKLLKGRIDIETKCVIHDMKPEEEHAANLLDVLKNMEMNIMIPDSGMTLELEDLKLKIILATDASIVKSGDPIEDTNNNSLAVLAGYKEKQFLFYGDGGGAYEDKLLERMDGVKIDVLKAAHHGGSEASSEKLLKQLQPQYAVVSSTSQETYGFPTDEILTRYALMQIPVFCTNRMGNIVFRTDGNEIWFYTEEKNK